MTCRRSVTSSGFPGRTAGAMAPNSYTRSVRARSPAVLSRGLNANARPDVSVDVGDDVGRLTAAHLLRAATVHTVDGDTDRSIDSAAYAYALAQDDDERGKAAVMVALGLDE